MENKPTISAIVLVKNEEKNIARCLEGLQWCNEILVADDVSTDTTVEIARKYKAIIFKHPLDNNFSQQRNFALEKATSDWVLFVDADEVVSSALADEIRHKIQDSRFKNYGYFLKRIDYMWGKQLLHGEQGDTRLLRLAKKGSGKWIGKVHEVWRVSGKIGQLKNPLLHYPHPTLTEFLKEINFYSTLRAEELHAQGMRANWLSILLYTKGKFAQDYFFKLGFLDGIEGFVVATLMSMHSFLVRGKLWQLSDKS